MGLTPLTFTGVSQFSNDFQTILDRARSIAQIPVQQLQNKDSDLLQRKNLLSGLSSAVNGLASSLSSLGSTAANRALAASSSDPDAVSVTNTGATIATSYTIDSITSAATAAAERTSNPYADSAATPVSSTGTVKLIVGAQNYTFELTNNTLVGLRDKINSLGAGVTASILTTGAGNYLLISANATGATTLQLRDDPTGANLNLLTSANQGTDAVFQLSGIDLHQAGNVVNNVIPGVTFQILGSSDTPVTLSVATDRSKLSAALQDFVSNYNTARAQVNAQIGPAAGLLTGDTVVSQLSTTLRQIAGYSTSTGTVKNLADLGVTFDSTGEASFNQATFDALPDSSISDAFTFLGSATSGLGGFSAKLTQFSDPIGGLIKTEQDGLDRTDRQIQDQIATLNDRIAVMQSALATKLQAADALLASLESQQKTLDASLQALSYTLYGKNPNQSQ